MLGHEGVADRDHLHAGGRVADVVHPAVRAHHPGGADQARPIVERAAGDVELRTLLRDHFIARQRDGAANRRPFTNAVRRICQIATHLQQAARRVPAITRIAAGAVGQQDEVTNVDPDILALDAGILAIARAVAQLIALDIHLDRVAAHIERHTPDTRDVDRRPIGDGNAAPAGLHGDLAALRHRLRPALEPHRATGDDLDAALVEPVGESRSIIESAQCDIDRLGSGLGQRITLAVERGGIAVEFGQDQRQAVLAQSH